MIDLDDHRLELVLASIGEHLSTEPVPDARARPASRRWVLGLAVAAATVLALVLAIAPVRSAVAGWLGIGSTRIVVDPTIGTPAPADTTTAAASASTTSTVPDTATTLPGIADGLRQIDARGAEDLLRRPLPTLDGTSLGPPAGYRVMPEGGVLVVWPDSTTLWIHRRGIDGEQLVSKLVSAGEAVQAVEGLGDAALAVVGGHVLDTPHRTISVDTTVLWQDGDLEWRLESDRPVEELIALARQLAAA
jgi:hypothetical protein